MGKKKQNHRGSQKNKETTQGPMDKSVVPVTELSVNISPNNVKSGRRQGSSLALSRLPRVFLVWGKGQTTVRINGGQSDQALWRRKCTGGLHQYRGIHPQKKKTTIT